MVRDTRSGTLLAHPENPDLSVGSVEHLMAALAGCGVHNVLVEVDGPELPALDGSADPFVFLLDCAGAVTQDAARPTIRVSRPVRVEADEGFVELAPGTHAREMVLSFEFPAPALAPEALSLTITPEVFRRDLARARKFTLIQELAELQAAGLALGCGVENTIIVEESGVRNPAGLRMPNEYLRHQLLDVIGDLALAGAAIRGRFVGHQTNHSLNNRLLYTLFADAGNWVSTGELSAVTEKPATFVAASAPDRLAS